MVLQDTWLFKGTIMENIRYGRLDATDEEVIAAAKAARAHHFIQTLPGGYQMELNEDASNVSQGQKQLLTIARANLGRIIRSLFWMRQPLRLIRVRRSRSKRRWTI